TSMYVFFLLLVLLMVGGGLLATAVGIDVQEVLPIFGFWVISVETRNLSVLRKRNSVRACPCCPEEHHADGLAFFHDTIRHGDIFVQNRLAYRGVFVVGPEKIGVQGNLFY